MSHKKAKRLRQAASRISNQQQNFGTFGDFEDLDPQEVESIIRSAGQDAVDIFLAPTEELTDELINELHTTKEMPMDALIEFKEMDFRYNRKRNSFMQN